MFCYDHCFCLNTSLGNIGKATFRNFQISVKLKRLESIDVPDISFKLSRWPFTLSKARALDRVQRKMVSIMLGVRLHPPEAFKAFSRSKNKLISATIKKNGRLLGPANLSVGSSR